MVRKQGIVTTFRAFETVHNQLRLDYKKICVQEFGKCPNDVTDKRLWAQQALKELQEIYNTAYGMFVFNEQEQLDDVYQRLLLCKIELGNI
tara:strand:+ start:567 stop:839 length:273 start_codon:yes stop_codon:yes gene_type:complete